MLSALDASLPASEVHALLQAALPMRGKPVPDIHWFYKARFCASFFIGRLLNIESMQISDCNAVRLELI